MIYNAVLVRGGIFFNLISLAKKERCWETIYGFSLAFYCLFEVIYEKSKNVLFYWTS